MAPEAVSTVVLCIIWVYSRKGNLIPSLKNRLFQVSLLTTFCAMTSNILSALLIFTLNPYTLVLTWAVNLIYFMTTPLMGMVYFFYVMANIYEDDPKIGKYFFFTFLPGMVYLILVLLSPVNHCVLSAPMIKCRKVAIKKCRFLAAADDIWYTLLALSVFLGG